MKKVLFSILALVATTSIIAQKSADEVAKFKSEVIDLGKLKVGSPSSVKFYVSNIGTAPLIIEQANPTCGCTVSDYTKSPIASGKSGEITATYNAAALGSFEKHLTVKFAGIEQVKSITIKGEVLSAQDYAKLNGKTIETKVKTEVKSADGKKSTKTKTKSTVASVKS